MTAIANVTVVGQRAIGPAPPPGTLAPPTTLLPMPPEGLDALSKIYLFESQDRQSGEKQSVSDVQVRQSAKSKAIKDENSQIQKAIDAQQHHSFWDDIGNAFSEIGKVCAVVGSIALTVASCGAGAPVALAVVACTLSVAGMAEGQFHVLEKMGVDPKAAGWIGLGLSIAGGVTSFGLGVATTGVAATSTATDIVGTGGKAATVIGGAADVGAGTSTIVSAQYEADALTNQANAKADDFKVKLAQQMVDSLLDDLRDDDKTAQRRLDEIQGTIQTSNSAVGAAVMTRA